MKYFFLRSFVKKFDHYHRAEQESITQTVEGIKKYLETQTAPYGLRMKNLSPRIYEARINIHLRIAFFRDGDVVKFFCLGSHDDIGHCLKNLRTIREP